MSDVEPVIARIETDFDFHLAVQRDPEQALASYNLSDKERQAFAQPGAPLWGLVLSRGADPGLGVDGGVPDGGAPTKIPPPTPPFTVTYHAAAKPEGWRFDPTDLMADPSLQGAVGAVRGAETPEARTLAAGQLMEQIG
jgi:hypothetical protein